LIVCANDWGAGGEDAVLGFVKAVHMSPPDLGWRVRYRADGSFTLTTSEGHVDGFYEAQNGVFTTRAPIVGADDQGAYRFINPTTLEMTGQLGVSVWRREAE
ncbi:MAG: hypothetical protein AAF719_13370, partial [Pseudomonadota bacterium]